MVNKNIDSIVLIIINKPIGYLLAAWLLAQMNDRSRQRWLAKSLGNYDK